MRRLAAIVLAVVSAATLWAAFAKDQPTAPRVGLTACHVEGVKEELRCGTYDVFENRIARSGRKLPLKIVVIAARHPHPDQGPVFYMAGGPGESATGLADLVNQ